MDKEYILAKLKELKPYLYEKYGISEIGLFGSYARGDYDENSDIDILVVYSRVISFFTIMDFIDDLQKLFNKKVDVANQRCLKKYVKDNVMSEVIFI